MLLYADEVWIGHRDMLLGDKLMKERNFRNPCILNTFSATSAFVYYLHEKEFAEIF